MGDGEKFSGSWFMETYWVFLVLFLIGEQCLGQPPEFFELSHGWLTI
jgi:hypothetical protein